MLHHGPAEAHMLYMGERVSMMPIATITLSRCRSPPRCRPEKSTTNGQQLSTVRAFLRINAIKGITRAIRR